jgi:hypothetical protein
MTENPTRTQICQKQENASLDFVLMYAGVSVVPAYILVHVSGM